MGRSSEGALERRKSSGSGSAVTEDGIEEAISVSVRVRPLNARELKSKNNESAWRVVEDESSIMLADETVKHTFDNVFDTKATTMMVYDRVARDLVSSVLRGMNGTVFAYGQTASGKTFTMQGEPQAPGILGLAAEQVFDEIRTKPHFQFLLNVSYIEIYNEQIKDLLSDSDNNLRIREDRDKGFFVDGLTTKSVISVEELLQAREEGERRRHVGETNMNARSSRSHTVFTIKIEMRDSRAIGSEEESQQRNHVDGSPSKDDELRASRKRRLSNDFEDTHFGLLVGQLNLVDLAGSENARATGADGGRLKEGGNINKSLLTLSRVISQLAAMKGKAGFINWRDSKLTQILQPSLAGNCRTAIVCCVTPASKFQEETKSTLSFASRAKQIRTRASVNEILDGQGEMRKLKHTIQELRVELASQQDLNAEKTALEEKIRSLKALLLTGGSHSGVTTASEVVAAANAKGQVISAGLPIAQSKRQRKHRETWAPGDFAAANLPPKENVISTIEEEHDGENGEVDGNAEHVDRRDSLLSSCSTASFHGEDDQPVFAAERIAALLSKVSKLEQQIRDVETSKEQLKNAHATDLEKQRLVYESSLEEIRETLQEANASMDQQQEQILSMNKKLEKVLKENEQNHIDFKASKDQIRSILEERTLECADLKEQLQAQQEKAAAIEQEQDQSLKSLLQAKQEKIELLESSADDAAVLKSELDAKSAELEETQKNQAQLKSQLAEQQAECCELRDKLLNSSKQADHETNTLSEAHQQIQDQLAIETKEKEALLARIAHMEEVLVEAEVASEALRLEVKTQKNRAEEALQKSAKVQTQFDELERKRNIAENDEIVNLKTQVEELQARLSESMLLEQQLAELDIEFIQNHQDSQAPHVTTIMEHVKARIDHVAKLELEMNNLQDTVADQLKNITALEQNLAEKVSELVEANAIVDKQQALLCAQEDASAQIEYLEKQLEEASHQAMQVDGLNATIRQLELDLGQAEEALDSFVANAETQMASIHVASCVESLVARIEVNEALAQQQQSILNSSGDNKKQLDQLRLQVDLTNQQANQTQAVAEERQTELLDQLQTAQTEFKEQQELVTNLNIKLASAKAQACQFETHANEVTREMEMLKAQLEESKLSAKSDLMQISGMASEQANNAAALKRISQLELQVNFATQEKELVERKLEEAKNQLKSLESDAVEDSRHSELQMQQATAKIDQLNTELSKSHARLDETQQSLKQTTLELETQRNLYENSHAEVQTLKTRIDELDNVHTKAIATADPQMEENLRISIAALEKKNNSLKELVREKEEVIERLQQELQQAEQEFSSAQTIELSSAMLSSDVPQEKADERLALMSEEIEEYKQRIQKLKENVDLLEQERQNQEMKVEDLQGQLSKSSPQVPEQVQQSLEQTKASEAEKERLIQELEEKLRESKLASCKLDEEKQQLVKELTDLHMKVTEQQIVIEQNIGSPNAEDVAALKAELESTRERVNKLEKVKLTKEQAQKIQQLKDDHKALKLKYTQVASSKEAMTKSFTELQQSQAIAQEQLTRLDALVSKARKSFGLVDPIQPEEFIKMIAERLYTVQRERDELARDVHENSSPHELESLQEELASAKREIEMLEQKVATSGGRTDQRAEEEILQLREESSKLRARLKEFESDFLAEKEESEKAKEAMSIQLEEHKTNIRFLEKENLDLMVAVRKAKEMSSTKKPLTGIDNKVESTRKDRSKSNCSEISDKKASTPAEQNKENLGDVNDENQQECATQ